MFLPIKFALAAGLGPAAAAARAFDAASGAARPRLDRAMTPLADSRSLQGGDPIELPILQGIIASYIAWPLFNIKAKTDISLREDSGSRAARRSYPWG